MRVRYATLPVINITDKWRPPVHWLLLISTLPGQNGALRISVWRTLKALGVGNLAQPVFVEVHKA